MADSPQTLQEFTTNLLSDLESGAISVHEAIIAAAQYSYLRDAIVSNKEILSQAELQSEEALTEALTKIVAESLAGIAELPNFGGQLPSAPLKEEGIRKTAELRGFAVARIRESSQSKLGKYSDRRRAFIHTLVERYSLRVPLSESQIGASFDNSLVGAAADAKTRQTKERFSELLVASVEASGGTLSSDQKAKLLLDTKSVFATNDAFVSESLKQTGENLALYEALIAHPDLKRPDVFIDVTLNAPPSEPLDKSILRAQKLAGVAEGLDEHGNKKVGKLQFFSTDAAKGVAGGIQKGADGILSLVGEPVRDMILHEKVNGTLRSMLSKPQEFIDRLGENFVRSALFTHITQNLTKQLSDRTPAGGGQVRSVFDDVVSSIFRGRSSGDRRTKSIVSTFVSSVFRKPLDPALTRATQEKILDYYELARASFASQANKKFLPPTVLPWEVFRIYESQKGSGYQARQYSPTFGKSLFYALGGGSIGSFLGNTFSSLVDRTTSFLFTNPFIPRQMSRSRRAASLPTRIADDMPLMVAIVVVAVIVLFFIFPSPFKLSQITHSSQVSSLFAALFSKEGEQGSGGGQSVDCTKNPSHQLCTFKSCPTCKWPTSGYITQGPNVQCDKDTSHASGNDVNGIDIASPGQIPVYAIDGGVVVYVYRDCGEGGPLDSCGGAHIGYGNNVVIKFNNGSTVIYGHLDKAINPVVQIGATIPPGTQLGWMNQSGRSTGQHLHFGVLSGGNVLDILPDQPHDKNKILGCVAGWLSAKCLLAGKSCPVGSVSAP